MSSQSFKRKKFTTGNTAASKQARIKEEQFALNTYLQLENRPKVFSLDLSANAITKK